MTITVYMISESQVNYELIAYWFRKELRHEIILARHLDEKSDTMDDATATPNDHLILFDCQDKSDAMVNELLENCLSNRINRPPIVLFNVARHNRLAATVNRWRIRGIFFEDDTQKLFAQGMQRILDGGLWLSRDLLSTCILLDRQADPVIELRIRSLSKREKQIAKLLGVGASNQDIADKLGICLKTVKSHVYHIYRKTGIGSRVEASYKLAGIMDLINE